jgi:signal transduction histidine kinase
MSRAETQARTSAERVASAGTNAYSTPDVGKHATAGIVHDLGNLLQVASSALGIVSRSPNVGAAPALVRVIDSANKSLRRAATLDQQTMRKAREPSDPIEYADVGVCLAEIELLIRTTWPSNIRLETSAVSAFPAVRCSQISLQSAIMNLAFNARDAMPNGGVISIAVAEISQGDLVKQIEVRVSDDGLGMTQETLARAFDPFFTTKTEGLGGLGLPMVRRFAEEVGGQVEIESEAGAGTAVTLRLPVLPETTALPQAIPAVSRVEHD